MLLLKMLLLCEVCTLLLQMETLQSRHLPAQMDWLAVCCVWGPQSRSVLQTDGGTGDDPGTRAPRTGMGRHRAPWSFGNGAVIAENLGHEYFTFLVTSAGKRNGDFRVNISGY